MAIYLARRTLSGSYLLTLIQQHPPVAEVRQALLDDAVPPEVNWDWARRMVIEEGKIRVEEPGEYPLGPIAVNSRETILNTAKEYKMEAVIFHDPERNRVNLDIIQ